MISDLNKQRRLGTEHESAQKPLGRETFYRDLEKNHLNHYGKIHGKNAGLEFLWRG